MAEIALGLHGGCGTLERSLQSEADWAESREHLARALAPDGMCFEQAVPPLMRYRPRLS